MGKYSIEDLDTLINAIKSVTKLTEEEISSRAEYNEGYIAQTKSRGTVPDKFISTIKREFKLELQNAMSLLNKKVHERKDPGHLYAITVRSKLERLMEGLVDDEAADEGSVNEPDFKWLPSNPGNYLKWFNELVEQNKLLKTQNELLKTSLNLDAALKKLKDTEEALNVLREQSASPGEKNKVEFGETENDSEADIQDDEDKLSNS